MTEDVTRGGRAEPFDTALLDALVRDGTVAFAFYDTDLRYRKVSQALARLNRRSVAEHLGRRPSEVLAGHAGVAIEESITRVLAGGKPYVEPDVVVEVPEWRGPRHQETHWLPVRGADGEVVGVAVLVTDITDRHNHVELLRSSQWRTSKLQRVTAELASALTVGEVRSTIANLARLLGAAHSEVRLLEEDLSRIAWPSVPSQRSSRWTRPVPEEWPLLLAAAIRDGAPIYAGDPAELSRTLRSSSAGGGGAATATKALVGDERAWAVLPMIAASGPIGVLYLAYAGERGFDADDRSFLEALAGQCALAVERARLHDREHRQVVALQRALLPDRLPVLPGIDVSFRYLAGAPDTEVGGDWYDAFEFADGMVGFVVGDVIGKGLGAAAGMGRVRTALRALAFTDPRPQAVITGLDRLFDATEGEESLTTLVYAVVDPVGRSLVMADAGHLPLLIVSADGSVRYEDAGVPATPLGVSEARADRVLVLEQGDIVIGFSDGLVENHERSLSDGLAVLADVASGRHDGLDPLLDRILDRMFDGHERDDDVTILGVHLLE